LRTALNVGTYQLKPKWFRTDIQSYGELAIPWDFTSICKNSTRKQNTDNCWTCIATCTSRT